MALRHSVPVALLLLLTGIGQAAGLLVFFRAENGIQFSDAVTVEVNNKDKVLNLGNAPKPSGPINKLQSLKLGGAMLADAESGVIVLYERGAVTYILPEGTPKTAPADPAGLWKASKIFYKRSQSDKKPNELDASTLLAFLPDGVEGLARFCADEEAMRIVGGKAKAFDTQAALITASVKQYGTDPALAAVEKYIVQAMKDRYEQFENGTGGAAGLEQCLRLADLSQAVYPSAPGHAEIRKALTDRQKWLDRKTAILRGFNAAQEWDAFLLGAREFEPYQYAFPEIAGLKIAALKQSLELHRQTGEARQKAGEYRAAYREFLLAGRRQPSDAALQQKILVAWTDYSRQLAIDNQRNRKQLTAGERDAIEQHFTFAARYKTEGRLDRAFEEIRKAETIDAESLGVLLRKAEILAAQRNYGAALSTLEEYDRHAIDDERRASSQLRNTLLFERNGIVEKLNAEFQKAWSSLSLNQARELARQAMLAKSDDPQVLFNNGIASLALRDRKAADDAFQRYLDVSNTLDGNPEQRATARRLLAPAAAAEAGQGELNWLSGKRLPKDVFYCPASLGFQPHVDRIEASNKLRVAYEWEGDKLKAITPAFEKPEPPTGERKIYFAYHAGQPVVWSAAYEAIAPPTDSDERLKRAAYVPLSYPDLDPVAIRALTGKNINIGISGNRFFHPFVWDKIHYFRLSYDAQGRVAQARELDASGAPGDLWIEFEWNGQRLMAVRGYQGVDEKQRVKIYDRTMIYQNGRLMTEEIRGQGKPARITYKYNANRLVSAECDRDITLDDRSRQVTFAANSATVQMQ